MEYTLSAENPSEWVHDIFSGIRHGRQSSVHIRKTDAVIIEWWQLLARDAEWIFEP